MSNDEYQQQQYWFKEDNWTETYRYNEGVIYSKNKTHITLHDSKPDIGILYPTGKKELIDTLDKKLMKQLGINE